MDLRLRFLVNCGAGSPARCQCVPVKENISINTPKLGPVGGRIVAEVFLGLLSGDKSSFLNLDPLWHPKTGPTYALKDFVRYALGH